MIVSCAEGGAGCLEVIDLHARTVAAAYFSAATSTAARSGHVLLCM